MATVDARTLAAFKVLLMVVICVLVFLAHIWARTLIVKKSYEIGDLKKEIIQIDADIAALTVEKNRLMSSSSLERLSEKFAEKGHVFQTPQESQIIYVNDSTRGEGAEIGSH
jgi:hypothetical protein